MRWSKIITHVKLLLLLVAYTSIEHYVLYHRKIHKILNHLGDRRTWNTTRLGHQGSAEYGKILPVRTSIEHSDQVPVSDNIRGLT